MRTITYDPAQYKIVPLEPTREIHQAGQDSGKDCAFSYSACYRAMLAAIPDNLPVFTRQPVRVEQKPFVTVKNPVKTRIDVPGTKRSYVIDPPAQSDTEVPVTPCIVCGGNDANAPCAYPSLGASGCVRDARIAAQADHIEDAIDMVDATRDDDDVVDDLAMMVRRLVHALSKASPGHALPAKAEDYLQRKGLQGSPLRDAAVKRDDVAVNARDVALTQLHAWFTAQRKAISNGSGSTWDMLQCDEQIGVIDAAVSEQSVVSDTDVGDIPENDDGIGLAPNPGALKSGMPAKLIALSKHMETTAVEMDYFGGFAPWARCGGELMGAAMMVAEWAAACDANEKEKS